MTQQNRTDPLDELRRADPVHPSPAPSESNARVWARIQAATVDATRSTSRRRLVWGGALAAAVAIGVAAVALALDAGHPNPSPVGREPNPSPVGREPDPSPTSSLGTGMASCVETYSLEALTHRSWAFDGEVIGVAGDEVTFDVNEAFRGDLGPEVRITAMGMTGPIVTSAGGPNLEVGQRYLVAGEDKWAWACGFTQPYDGGVAADWREATR